MDKVFSHLTGHCVEVYVDDMVVKSPSHHQHAKDLEAVFSALRRYNLRLNPDKCVFSVDRGKFLGFMLTQRGIEIQRNAQPHYCQRSPTPNRPPHGHFSLPTQTSGTNSTHNPAPKKIRPVHVD